MPQVSLGAAVCRSRRRAECLSCRCPQPLPGITGGAYALPPGAVRQIPVDGAGNAGFEVVRGFPGECQLGARGVDFVAEVVPGPVGDEADQSLAWAGGI